MACFGTLFQTPIWSFGFASTTKAWAFEKVALRVFARKDLPLEFVCLGKVVCAAHRVAGKGPCNWNDTEVAPSKITTTAHPHFCATTQSFEKLMRLMIHSTFSNTYAKVTPQIASYRLLIFPMQCELFYNFH